MSKNRMRLAALLAAALAPLAAQAQLDWNAPFPPHRVIDNIYFVGTETLGTFLITTPEGHILINSDFETTVPVIRRNVEALGFDFEDIEILLGSHAHGDHMEADALVKELTGARVMAMDADIPALLAMRPGGKAHPIDRILHDGDEVTLGGTTLTAYRMPGHTRGCTSWGLEVEEAGETYNALIICSFGVNDNYVLVDNLDYPEIADDYVATYARARTMPVDVFLGSHGFFYDMESKYERMQNRREGDPNPFVDRAGYLRHIDMQEERFETMLAEQLSAAGTAPRRPETASEVWQPAHDLRLVGTNGLQGRSAYQPVVHNFGDRRILFVGHHAGEALNPLSGRVEVNGASILDVTNPAAPELLVHLPPTGDDAQGTQHVQICDGAVLPGADADKVYMLRTNGNIGWDLFDVTDPAAPKFMRIVAETGTSSRPTSDRGNQETHKMQWDCASGIAYLNGTPEGWRVTRLLQIFDLGNPEAPRHIRDFGLVGWEPDASGPMPAPEIAGLHQPVIVGDRAYLGYESGGNGVLQILDTRKLLEGIPGASDPYAPTAGNLLYPEIARLDMPSYWGVHTAKPIYGLPIPDYGDDRDNSTRDVLIVVSEAAGGSGRRCQQTRDVMFMIDITEEQKPIPISTFQVAEEPGDYCHRGGRFGPHSVHDAYHPNFDKTLAVLSYFNAGVRVVDIRNPFRPEEVAWFVPETNRNTTEACVTIDGVRHCDRAISTNNVNLDDRGLIYAVDRAGTGLHVLELTGEARRIAGLGPSEPQ